MLSKNQVSKALKIVSQAWGRTQTGWCFFPYIDREEQIKTGKRRAGFHEGKPFFWPDDREEIVDFLYTHQQYDVYWCPSLFEFADQGRTIDNAMDECALWADLDEVDPRELTDYPPTIAWETSPGRYQCLWLINQGDIQGASWAGQENQRMTYMIGADPSGWDTVQLLRLPFWLNHKPDYRTIDDECPQGRLLWDNGKRYQPGDFSELPEVQGFISAGLSDALEAEVDGVDRYKVIARVKLKLNRTARELLTAKSTSGDVSSSLWYLMRCLADVDCSIAEIVAVVRKTVWNKFKTRPDELRTLINEASKAVAKVKTEKPEDIPEEDDLKPQGFTRFGDLLKNVRRPTFLVKDLIQEAACGFIAGEPKAYKSWTALDLAISVSTGAKFLNTFEVINPGPVLYIQEEDPAPTLKTRTAKIWASKSVDKLELVKDDGVFWLPPEQSATFDPDINALVQRQFTISDEEWMIWLDECLEAGMTVNGVKIPYRLLLIDTLMMTAGNVEENKSQEMTTKVFRPLKQMRRKHNVAVYVVHHMGKADQSRPGKRMLGSVANHAWAEDSLYLSTDGYKIKMELESKAIPGTVYAVNNVIGHKSWDPQVVSWDTPDEIQENVNNNWPLDLNDAPTPGARTIWEKFNTKTQLIREFMLTNNDFATLEQLTILLNSNDQAVKQRMTRLEKKYGYVKCVNNNYQWIGPT